MIRFGVAAVAAVQVAHGGLFGTREARVVRDEVVGRVHLTPGPTLSIRARNEAELRAFANTSLGLGPVVLSRADDEVALDLGLFAPTVNEAWLSKMGPVLILPDERGGISISAATCAEVDRAGVWLRPWQSARAAVQSLEPRGAACRLDITGKIAPRVAETLGQVRPGVNGLNAALYALNLTDRAGRSGARELRDALDQRCRRRPGAPEFGDLVVIFDHAPARGPAAPLHAYVHLVDELAFEKPGRNGIAPYWFTPSARILDEHEVGWLDRFPAKPSGVGRRYALAYTCAAR